MDTHMNFYNYTRLKGLAKKASKIISKDVSKSVHQNSSIRTPALRETDSFFQMKKHDDQNTSHKKSFCESKETKSVKIIYSSIKKKQLFEHHFISIINKYNVNDNNIVSLHKYICDYLKCYYLNDYNKLTLNPSQLLEIDTKIKQFSENKKLKLERNRMESKKIVHNLKNWKCYQCNIIYQNYVRLCPQCTKGINPLLFIQHNQSETFTVDKPFGILHWSSRRKAFNVCNLFFLFSLITIAIIFKFVAVIIPTKLINLLKL